MFVVGYTRVIQLTYLDGLSDVRLHATIQAFFRWGKTRIILHVTTGFVHAKSEG